MLYRFVRALNELYGVTVLGGFVVAFFVAFAMMLYPIVAIVMLIVAIYAVVVFWFIGRVLRMIERGVARRALTRGVCPACGETLERFTLPGEPKTDVLDCGGCGRAFVASGDPWSASTSSPPLERVGGVAAG